jgi:hypothetical protein
MKTNDLKRGVYETLLLEPFDDNIDRLIVSCVLYTHLEKVISLENKNQNTTKQLAQSYSQIFISNFLEYKSVAVGYNLIRQTIIGYRKNSFLDFLSSQIEEVKKLYENKTRIVPFSISKFSQYMYKVGKISHPNYIRLADIHQDIMIPIAKFYINSYKIDPSDLEILTAEDYAPTPGRVIIFKIKDITTAKIVNDIKTRKIPVNYYNVETFGEYVKIITN